MIKNYLKVAIRNFIRNKVYVLINVLGLGFGIACSIVAYINWQSDNSFDRMHVQGKDIFKVNSIRDVNDALVEYSVVPLAFEVAVNDRIAGIERASTVLVKQEIFKKDEEVWFRKVGYVSDSFFDMFTYQAIHGSVSSFKEASSVVITESTALKYYGNSDVVGNQIQLSTNSGQLHDYSIIAVVADPPTNTSLKMEVYLPIHQFEVVHDISLEDWSEIGQAFFIQANEQFNPEIILKNLNPMAGLFNNKREDWEITGFKLVPFYQMAQQARNTKGNYLEQANPIGSVMVPSLMAFLILLIGCFNFTNTSIALSEKRLKEIGIRKALGGQRNQLALQIIAENAILCMLSLALGIVLAEVLVPAYNQMGPWVNNSLNYRDNLPLFGFLAAMLALVVLVSSIYPALYVSKLDAAKILKGSVKYKNTNWLTKILIVLQLSISLSTLIQGAGYYENATYQKQFDYGFDKDGVITVPVKDGRAFEQLKHEVEQNPSIMEIAGSVNHIGTSYSMETMEFESVKREVSVFGVGNHYLKTNGLELVLGRYFLDSKAEIGHSVIVNNSLVEEWMLLNPIGRNVRINDKIVEIVGVVKDFYPQGLWIGQKPKPALFQLSDRNDFRFLTIKTSPGWILETNDEVKKAWKQLFPYQPYKGEIENQGIYLNILLNRNMVLLNIILAGIALLLSGIGLFNMVSMNVIKQKKAVGVRKVLGASIYQILYNLSRPSLILVFIALALGAGQGYFLTGVVLDLMYTFHIVPGTLTITGSVILVIVILFGIILVKTYNEAKRNPVEALRCE